MKKSVSFTLLAVSLLTLMTACGKKENSADSGKVDTSTEKKVDITIGGINVSDSKSDKFFKDNEVIKSLEKKFNVNLKTINYTNESLNLDLSGGKTADIIQVNDNHISSVIQGKHAVDLDKYKDTLGKNIFADMMTYRNKIVTKFKSNGENKLYFVTPHVTSDSAKFNYGTNLYYGYGVRWDLYKKIGMPEINNDDDYIAALEKMKEIYPKTESGEPVYAMSAYNDSGLHSYFFKGCIAEGYTNLENGVYVVNAQTNEILPDFYDAKNPDVVTPFWSGVKFYNKLYNKGLLDPDNFITKGEDLNDKYKKGQYIGASVNWHYGGYNLEQQKKDAKTLSQFVMLPGRLGWAKEHNPAGYFGKYFFVSSHSPNKDRALMILDYLQSEEFSRMVDSGVEGSTWKLNDQNKPALTDEIIDMKLNQGGSDEFSKKGIGQLSSSVGQDDYNVAKDGGLMNLWLADDVLEKNMNYAEIDLSKTYGVKMPSDLLANRVKDGKSIDLDKAKSVIQIGLETTPKDIVRIDSNCTEITTKAVPKLVQAKDDAEFDKEKAALLKDLKAAGVEKSIDWWTKAWESATKGVESLE